MNPILELIRHPAASRWGEVLLHFLWQGTAVAAPPGGRPGPVAPGHRRDPLPTRLRGDGTDGRPARGHLAGPRRLRWASLGRQFGRLRPHGCNAVGRGARNGGWSFRSAVARDGNVGVVSRGSRVWGAPDWRLVAGSAPHRTECCPLGRAVGRPAAGTGAAPRTIPPGAAAGIRRHQCPVGARLASAGDPRARGNGDESESWRSGCDHGP